MNKEYKTIHKHIYNPVKSIFKSSSNDKAELHLVKCCNSENCSLFKKGQCIERTILGPSCPYGKRNTFIGFTKRAKNFSTWIRQQEEKYKDVGSLSSPPDKIAKVGDYIYLPYPHIEMNKSVPFLAHSAVLIRGKPFLHKDDFTITNILKIVGFHPMALMGGEITKYQKEIIPKFLVHLKEFNIELYNELLEQIPHLEEKYKVERSIIGRTAYLNSLKPSMVYFKKQPWKWDGENLHFMGDIKKISLWLGIEDHNRKDSVEDWDIKIKPNKDTCVVISNLEQVDGDTIFVD